MNSEELVQKILDIPSETQTIEFKRVGGNKNEVGRIIEAIVATANADGVIIVLGVDDPEKTDLKGFDRIFGTEENLENYDAIGREIQRIVPPLTGVWPPEEIFVKETGKKIALLFVTKATGSFYSINNHVYVRQSKSNKLLTPQEVIRFAYAKGFEKADRELVDIDFELLNTKQYADWKNSRRLEGTETKNILEKTGLARKDKSNNLLPTRAAVLLFAEYPKDLMETKSTVRILQYTGTIETFKETPNLIGAPKTINGPIVKQIADTHEYVLTLLRSGIKIPFGFVTQYQLPERAVKEAI